MIPQPRAPLPDAYAEAAYLAAYRSAARRGIWQAQFAMGLEMFARIVSQYVGMVRTLRDPEHPELVTIRELVRAQAFEWHLVDDPESPPLRSDGFDPDIARIAGLTGILN